MIHSASPRLQLVTTPLKVRGTSLPALLLEPNSSHLHLLEQDLRARLDKGGELLRSSPLVVELSENCQDLDLEKLQALCNQLGIHLYALRTQDEHLQESAERLGLMVLKRLDRPARTLDQEALASTLVKEGGVRSGQQLVNEKGDLVILGPVNPGAEVLASGCIHIYGALRGRALAGIHGNEQASVFALHLDAELVAIAGHYQTGLVVRREAGPSAARVQLVDERLVVNSLIVN